MHLGIPDILEGEGHRRLPTWGGHAGHGGGIDT